MLPNTILMSGLAMRHRIYGQIDPRIKHWVFVGDPLFPLIVCGGYLLFTYVTGPRFMKNRQPFDLRWAIRLHNLFMIVMNAYFLVQFLTTVYRARYNPFCQGMTYATDEASLRYLELGWWFMLVRSLDLLDTIFFVLRKKDDHVTFQHVSHHFCCIFTGHIFLSLGMDGQSWFGVCINTGIHVVMYAYYFLATLGPRMKPYLWWKKHLTIAQIVQHYLIILHGLIPYFYDCGYPRFLLNLAMPQGLLGLALFINFYALSYTGRKNWADIFSGVPCVLSDDNDPTKFKRFQMELERGKVKDTFESEDDHADFKCPAKECKTD
ncbi:elongation of very long chain fatty acids protein 4-like [Tropilaelaps mercedesae]|uniref:Elongation of very long chain fatty acids protein n=1 Tax=Tropilaelaps mercedesae TaxID=418985 RepID=A0A1V9XPL4_9ACAR|nr:elongation of very long chain fatty acids protein 4-like [Tropilaelaps mercedesae]